MTTTMFALGRLTATPGAIGVLAGVPEALALLARHVSGDWGEVDDHDRLANDHAARRGVRILSAYMTASGDRLWVITEADRSGTCLLLPEEY